MYFYQSLERENEHIAGGSKLDCPGAAMVGTTADFAFLTLFHLFIFDRTRLNCEKQMPMDLCVYMYDIIHIVTLM